MTVRKSDYTYDLPEELIADRPASPRDASRLLRVDRRDRTLAHHRFRDLPALLEDGTVLVLNNTRVIPARLPGRRDSGGNIEVLLVEETAPGLWRCKVKNAARLRRGERLQLCDNRLEAVMTGRTDGGDCLLAFDLPDGLMAALEKFGYAPLPPYIQKVRHQPVQREEDLRHYQTVYASVWGAIAAPTAGLHFSPEVLTEIRSRGIESLEVTLHVGPGTFEPVRSDDVRSHRMHSERYHLTEEVAERLNRYRKEGRTVTAVGTTVVRTLESAVRGGTVIPGSGHTDLFIYPPYRFQVVNRLLTNFHLPESTLLMMVSAFADRELILTAYREAVQQRYRFFSYGDCMLIR